MTTEIKEDTTNILQTINIVTTENVNKIVLSLYKIYKGELILSPKILIRKHFNNGHWTYRCLGKGCQHCNGSQCILAVYLKLRPQLKLRTSPKWE